jgi:hypothetical protein
VICHMNSSVDGRNPGQPLAATRYIGTGSRTFSKLRRPRSSSVNAPPTRTAIAPLLIRIAPSCAEATRLAEDSAKCQFGWGRGSTDPSSQRGTDSSNPFPSSGESGANLTSSPVVDHAGEVLDVLVQRRRDDSRAALRLMRKLLKEQGFAPSLLVTDKLRFYASAFRRPRLTCPHEQGLRGNNRAENSHQAVQRRERNSICITTATRWLMSSAARSPSRLHQPKARSNPTARQPHNQISSAPSNTEPFESSSPAFTFWAARSSINSRCASNIRFIVGSERSLD